MSINTLKNKNQHQRDYNLLFDEPTHKYTITTDPDSKYTSVTTWNHSHFPKFDADAIIKNMMRGKNWNPENKYWGKTAQEIKDGWTKNATDVSGAGTNLHYEIECFMNQELPEGVECTHQALLDEYNRKQDAGQIHILHDVEEWQFFIKFIMAFPHLKPYRTEWTIYNEEVKLAGSIDMVYENPDGTLMIYDWKRSKEITKSNGFGKYALTPCIEHLPDTNYWHYSLQLNTYKAILEAKYDKKITDLYLVRLHPNNTRKSFDLIKVADLTEELRELLQARIA